MAFTLRVHDTFAGTFNAVLHGRTPDTVGSDAWAEETSGSFAISLAATTLVTTNQQDKYAYVPTTIANKQAAETINGTTQAGNWHASACTRMSTDGDGYLGLGQRAALDNSWYIQRGDNGTRTNLTNGTGGIAAGDTVRLESDGTTHTFTINGAGGGNTTDATYSSGFVGIWNHGADYEFGDFKGYDDAGGGGTAVKDMIMCNGFIAFAR
jgi:hypothetical protein